MISLNKLKYFLIFLISIFFLIIFLDNLINFGGNKFFYFIFSLFSFYFLISIFFERKYFTEIFLGIYLWLGYWWKFSYLQFINVNEKISLSASEGFVPQLISKNILNETFYSLIIAYIALFLSFKIFKFFNNDYFNDFYDQENYFSNSCRRIKISIYTKDLFVREKNL